MDELTEEEIAALNAPIQPVREYTPDEKRIIADFEGILRFYDQHQRPPSHEADNIFERRYAARLDLLKQSALAQVLLTTFDFPGLLYGGEIPPCDLLALANDPALAAAWLAEMDAPR